ncbi:MAG: heme lyase CcmF/NrfE family subunit [Anaerolineae bacterium]
MLAEIGLFSTFLAFAASVYAAVASLYGVRTRRESWVISGRNAALLSFAMVTVATGSLLVALMTEDYQLAYIWSVSSPDMTAFFRLTALWGSQAGSLLFWSFLMAAFAAAAIVLNWRSQRRLMPYVVVYMMVVLAFFLGLSLFVENPFTRYWVVNNEVVETLFIPAGAEAIPNANLASTARGLNPLLRHFGMAIHPPMLYLGFVGFTIPFAFAMAALASGDLSSNWIKATRRWSLVAWLFLSLGLLLGGRWAYDVLGWGGYWGWDPVENAAFLPWLIGTAFLHSVLIQEKRGMLKTWNMVLVIGTFSAVIFGTFATRSGLVESVHSFARSGIGMPMFLFWSSLTLVSIGLILWRWNRGELRDDHAFQGIFSREALFVFNNFVFVVLTAAIFWGSFGAPIISELFFDTNITLGTDYFLRVTPPLFAVMYVLMGIAPLTGWGVMSFRHLQQRAAVPFILTLLTLAFLFVVLGMRQIGALLGYGIVTFAGWVAIYEAFRAVQARVQTHRENPFFAFITVVSRNPRRYGGYMIHLGVTIIGLGVIGSTLFQIETQRTLAPGESLTLGQYEVRFDSFDGGQVASDGRIMEIANVSIIRNGTVVANLRPRQDIFTTGDMSRMTIAGAHSTLENDVYVLLVSWDEISENAATFKVYVNPLINLVWLGGVILMFGTFIAVYPREVLASQRRKAFQAVQAAPQRA